jgi:hypothetical protein
LDGATMFTDAVAAAPHSLALEYVIDGSHNVQFVFPRVFLSRPAIGVKGPGGVEQTLDFEASHDPSTGAVFQATWTT